MTTMTTYTALCEHVGGWWEITVPELAEGGATQVRHLDDVDVTVRDLVCLMTDADPASVKVRAQVTANDRPDRRGRLVVAAEVAVAAAAAAAVILRRVLAGR